MQSMEYMSTKEAAEKWGYAQSTISKWCKEGKISLVVKAEKQGGRWKIPADAECPRKNKSERAC